MSKRNDKDYISHIIEATKRISAYTENMTYEEFLEDIKTQDSVIRIL
jgi:uncharacterized protein with HEPN domain